MSVRYRIDILNWDGTKLYEIAEFRSLQYTKKRNSPGECTFSMDDNSEKASNIITPGRHFKVYRQNRAMGLDWHHDFQGTVRAYDRSYNKIGTLNVYAPGMLIMLADRIVAYPPDTVDRSLFTNTPVETILHTLVKYNATVDATVDNGRLRDGNIRDGFILMRDDQLRGDAVPLWECSEDNLLDTLQQLAEKYHYTFELQRSTTEYKYYFTIFPPGTYNTINHVFALERGNIGNITYTYDMRSEKTVAIAGGKRTDDGKEYSIVTADKYALGGEYNKEMYISASNADDTAGLNKEAFIELSKLEAKARLDIKVIQSPGSYYGRDYNLNHFVIVKYKNTNYTYCVDEVTVRWSQDAGESVDIKLTSESDLVE